MDNVTPSSPKVKPPTRYSLMHDCPPGGCRTYFLPERVILRAYGAMLITNRLVADKVLVSAPDGAHIEIEGDPHAIDTEWYPPIVFSWEEH